MPSLSVACRNAMLNAIVATIGASPVIQIRTGSAPTVESEDTGSLLASFALGSTWAAAAQSGSVQLTGLPITTQALASGTASHFRLKASNGTTHASGTVTRPDEGGDVELDTTAALDITATIELASGADSVTIEKLKLAVTYGA